MGMITPYITALRPIGWIPFWFSLTLGMIDGGFNSISSIIAGLSVFGPLILGSIYTLNFYSDSKYDSKSTVTKDVKMSQQPFSSGAIAPKAGLIYAAVLMIAGLAVSAVINTAFFIVSSYVAIVLTVYSLPPIRLKERLFGDIFANSTTAGAASYIAGYVLFKDISTISVYPIIWLTLLVAATYLLTVVIDFEPDKKSKLRTTATVLGAEKAISLSTGIYFLSLVFYALTLRANWKTLAYWLLLPPLLKSPFSYVKLYHDNSRLYYLSKRAVQWAAIGVFGILVIYAILFFAGIPDTSIMEAAKAAVENQYTG